jgi:hypothetical protein
MHRIASAAAALALAGGALLGLAGTSAADPDGADGADADGISVVQCVVTGGQIIGPGPADDKTCWGGLFDGSPIDVDG